MYAPLVPGYIVSTEAPGRCVVYEVIYWKKLHELHVFTLLVGVHDLSILGGYNILPHVATHIDNPHVNFY
jgi:hypothetical protein